MASGVPKSGLSVLSKSIIQINGVDATKFLNGLITTRMLPTLVKKKQHTISEGEDKHEVLKGMIDIHKNWGVMHEDIYDPNQTIYIGRNGLNSMFLNSKGRVINDCFVYPNPFTIEENDGNCSYLVEIDDVFASKMQSMLKIHKLTSKVKIKKLSTMKSLYYYNDSVDFDDWLEDTQAKYFRSTNPTDALSNSREFIEKQEIFGKSTKLVGLSIDNRIPNFGVKFLIDTEELPDIGQIFSELFKSQFGALDRYLDEEVITQRRFLNGLFEPRDASPEVSLLPFETNLDYVNGLSLEKGCYVGQELTIRTFNNGVIRKRIFPVQFFPLSGVSVDDIPETQDLTLETGSPLTQLLMELPAEKYAALEVVPIKEDAVEDSQRGTAAPSPFGAPASPFESSKAVRSRKKSASKILSIQDNLGFVLCNSNTVGKNKLFKTEINGQAIGIRVNEPDWWPES